MLKEARDGLFRQYAQRLQQKGWKARLNGHVFEHLVWMCLEAQTFEDAEKAQRWLGFVQGVLWSRGETSIDALRSDVRGANFGGTEAPALAS